MSIHELCWIVFALLAGGIIKGSSGIGLPMIAVPLLAFAHSLEHAATLLSLPVLCANLIQVKDLPANALKQPWLQLLALSLLLGMGLGSLVMSDHPRWLMWLTGLSIIAFGLVSLTGLKPTIPPRLRAPVALLSGGFAGFTGGSTAMYGWPLVLFLSSLPLNPAHFISIISLLYLMAHSLFLLLLLVHGSLTPTLILMSAAACIPVFTGVKIGRCIAAKLSTGDGFQRLISILMLAGGVSLLFKA